MLDITMKILTVVNGQDVKPGDLVTLPDRQAKGLIWSKAAELAPAKPAAEQPEAEQPAAEQPEAEQPAAEQPAADKPAAEQPAADKAAAEQPAADKPARGRGRPKGK